MLSTPCQNTARRLGASLAPSKGHKTSHSRRGSGHQTPVTLTPRDRRAGSTGNLVRACSIERFHWRATWPNSWGVHFTFTRESFMVTSSTRIIARIPKILSRKRKQLGFFLVDPPSLALDQKRYGRLYSTLGLPQKNKHDRNSHAQQGIITLRFLLDMLPDVRPLLCAILKVLHPALKATQKHAPLIDRSNRAVCLLKLTFQRGKQSQAPLQSRALAMQSWKKNREKHEEEKGVYSRPTHCINSERTVDRMHPHFTYRHGLR